MGRKPLPNEVKKMHGETRQSRLRPTLKAEPVTAIDKVLKHPAAQILNTSRQVEILREKAEWLISLEILEAVDIDALVDYAVIRSLWEDALESARQYPLTMPITGKDGGVVGFNENPYIRQALKYQKELSRMGSEFGFTPIARQKLPEKKQSLTGIEILTARVNAK